MARIASISGGKDSTAMLIILYEQGIDLDHIVFLNTGLEFPETIRFIREKLDPWCREHFGLNITFIYPKKPFGYYFQRWGAPHCPNGRWCCKHLKEEPFKDWLKYSIEGKDVILYLGYSLDEIDRYQGKWVKEFLKKSGKNVVIKAPLIEAGITEREALEICKRYDLLNPLYKYFRRTGCWLCPFQPISEWFKIYKYFPQMWKAAKAIEKRSIEMGKFTFRPDGTLEDLERKFKSVKTLVEVENGLNGHNGGE